MAHRLLTALTPIAPPDAPLTLEQLLDRLAAVKKLKEQLEKQEKGLVGEIQKRLGDQQQRLKRLGVPVKDEPTPAPVQTGATPSDSYFRATCGGVGIWRLKSAPPWLPGATVMRLA